MDLDLFGDCELSRCDISTYFMVKDGICSPDIPTRMMHAKAYINRMIELGDRCPSYMLFTGLSFVKEAETKTSITIKYIPNKKFIPEKEQNPYGIDTSIFSSARYEKRNKNAPKTYINTKYMTTCIDLTTLTAIDITNVLRRVEFHHEEFISSKSFKNYFRLGLIRMADQQYQDMCTLEKEKEMAERRKLLQLNRKK